MKIICEISKGVDITFHRAFDMTERSLLRSTLQDIIDLGCHRLLTSGMEAAVRPSNEVFVEIYDFLSSNNLHGKLLVIAGAGMNINNVSSIVQMTKVHGVHTGSAVTISMPEDRDRLDGFAPEMLAWNVVSVDKVQQFIRAANSIHNLSV